MILLIQFNFFLADRPWEQSRGRPTLAAASEGEAVPHLSTGLSACGLGAHRGGRAPRQLRSHLGRGKPRSRWVQGRLGGAVIRFHSACIIKAVIYLGRTGWILSARFSNYQNYHFDGNAPCIYLSIETGPLHSMVPYFIVITPSSVAQCSEHPV